MPILTLAGPARARLAAEPLFTVPSLRQLIARHATLLVVDASAPRVEASVWCAGQFVPRAVVTIPGEASAALPVAVARVLVEAGGPRLPELAAAAFCDGPGSVLGIRLSAASLRAWRAVRPALATYSFHSLPLLGVAHPGLVVVADARRDTWHVVRPAAPHALLRVPSAELAAEGDGLATPEGFRRWSAPPAGAVGAALRELPYSAAALLAAAPDEPFFADAPEPDAFVHEAPGYAAWVPRIHQAPTTG